MRIRRAREHNLQGLDLDLAHDRIHVVTGVSGSGKSSLVMDCIHREGQRRYLESFSTHARQFLARLPRPDVESITGARCTAAVAQHRGGAHPRSTVGTFSGIWDHLRLLWARVGRASCPACGGELEERPVAAFAETLRRRFGGRMLRIMAPLVDGHRGRHAEVLRRAVACGVRRFAVDGELVPAGGLDGLDPATRHRLEAEIAEVDPAREGGLEALLARAFDLGAGVAVVRCGDEELRWAQRRSCPACDASVPEIGPRLFSFNGRWGACPACGGLGVEDEVDPELLVADPARSIREGALVPTTPKGYVVYSQVTVEVMDSICRAHGFTVDTPWKDLSDEQRGVIFHGTDRLTVPFGKHPLENRLKWSGITARPREEGHYKGLVPTIEAILARDRNKNALRFARTVPCRACGGRRLGPDALSVRVAEVDLGEASTWSLQRLRDWLDGLETEPAIRRALVGPAVARLSLLVDLGVGHLSCHRGADELSGGEMQRLRLAAAASAEVTGLTYVLDEPSVGVHPGEIPAMLDVFRRLRDRGNTVLVTEHDPRIWAGADRIHELGPGAAEKGGRLVCSLPPTEAALAAAPSESRLPHHLGARKGRRIDEARSPRAGRGELVVRGARHRNLKGDDVVLRLGALNAVTGPSGAGKSSLVEEVLGRALRARLHGARERPGRHEAIEGAEGLGKVIDVDQKPIGRSPRSNAATYTKLFDGIRALYADTDAARARGLGRSHFSFNTKGGRCERCEGAGVETVGLHFLADAVRPCEACGGRRFRDEVLAVTVAGLNVAQMLELTVDEAFERIGHEKKLRPVLDALRRVGLGYLRLGQGATTLSGGEAQRVKLATHLARPGGDHALYLLDEPTAGLHPDDVGVLLEALDGLVARGHTVVVVEHDLDVIRRCDWMVDLGPGGGDAGGRVCAMGTPAELARREDAPTGRFLAAGNLLGGSPVDGDEDPPAFIELEGLRTHNLRDLDLRIPREKITVITGISGSGKSSLAFDSVAAEGQARVFEGMSGWARRFLGGLERPDLDRAAGLGPTVALGQEGAGRNPRSTVGTASEVDELLRLLFARYGRSEDGAAMSASAFSFNGLEGACPACGGLGHGLRCDPDALVTHPERSLFDGAMDGTKTGAYYGERDGRHLAELRAAAAAEGHDFSPPWAALDETRRRFAMDGAGDRVYAVVWDFKRGRRTGRHAYETPWIGFARLVEDEWARKHGDRRAEALEELMREVPCAACGGERLGEAARRRRWAGRRLPELWAMSLGALLQVFGEDGLPGDGALLDEIRRRCGGLVEGGLGHLSLGRSVESLSGGELQRLRLATQLGVGLTGLTYVLDEPTRGLHAADREALVGLLERLRDEGNTVVVVEHDPAVIRRADVVIDLGPGAGAAGGRIVAAGTPAELAGNPASVTGPYLGRPAFHLPLSTGRSAAGEIAVTGAARHNLVDLDAAFPLGQMTAVTGPSGAGKSTLVFEVLAESLRRGRPVGCRRVEGGETLDGVVTLRGATAGRSPASTLLTATGLMDELRRVFAACPEAREAGLKKAAFSYLSREGACPACKGFGRTRLDLDFLGALWMPCEDCGGQRYGETVGGIRWKGRSLPDILALTVAEARGLPLDGRSWENGMALLERVGLGHLRLGQGADQLSGGEAQRLALVAEMTKAKKGRRRLFLFDEPTRGLHPRDVAELARVLDALADEGHTVLLVEHDLDLARHCDRILDLGPGGGPEGGRLVYAGCPEGVVGREDSATGRAMAMREDSATGRAMAMREDSATGCAMAVRDDDGARGR